jgi:phosphate/sulfate permease
MKIWTWWKAQWPSAPTHLCVASVTAGALLMAGLLSTSTLGWQAPITVIALVSAAIMGFVTAAIESNCTGRMFADAQAPATELSS